MSDGMTREFTYYLDGKYVPMSEAKIFVFDPACLGDSVYDTLRTVHRDHIFRIDDHIERLYASCRAADLEPKESRSEMKSILQELVDQNRSMLAENDDVWLVPRIASGLRGGTTTLAAVVPLPFRRYAPFFKLGTHLIVPDQIRHLPPTCIDPCIKNDSRLFMHIADRQVRRIDPDARTLLLDIDGNVAELTNANLFIVRDGEVVTPPSRNTLGGISRSVVMELCKSLGLPLAERDFRLDDLYTADEVFQTATNYRMLPVSSINQSPLWPSVPGPLTSRLLAAYDKELGLDIAEQYLSHLTQAERDALDSDCAT